MKKKFTGYSLGKLDSPTRDENLDERDPEILFMQGEELNERPITRDSVIKMWDNPFIVKSIKRGTPIY